MEPEKIIVELSEKIAKSGLYTSKGGEIKGIAKNWASKWEDKGRRFGEGQEDTIQRRASV